MEGGSGMGDIELTCSECGNTTHFHWDWVRGEVVCQACGTVVGRIINRYNYEAFNSNV